MLAKGLHVFTDIPITLAGLIFFVFAFILVLSRTFLVKGSKAYFEKTAQIPLLEEQTPGETHE